MTQEYQDWLEKILKLQAFILFMLAIGVVILQIQVSRLKRRK